MGFIFVVVVVEELAVGSSSGDGLCEMVIDRWWQWLLFIIIDILFY